jgi:hypothetical protein
MCEHLRSPCVPLRSPLRSPFDRHSIPPAIIPAIAFDPPCDRPLLDPPIPPYDRRCRSLGLDGRDGHFDRKKERAVRDSKNVRRKGSSSPKPLPQKKSAPAAPILPAADCNVLVGTSAIARSLKPPQGRLAAAPRPPAAAGQPGEVARFALLACSPL